MGGIHTPCNALCRRITQFMLLSQFHPVSSTPQHLRLHPHGFEQHSRFRACCSLYKDSAWTLHSRRANIFTAAAAVAVAVAVAVVATGIGVLSTPALVSSALG